MLTESGGVIRYVFLWSAGLSDFVLIDGGCCRPVFLVGDSEISGFATAAMSLRLSPLAMSYRVGMSGWTVCYSSVESHDSVIAIV